MARHATTKSTSRGKVQTCSRKAIRSVKFYSPALDIPALEHELVRQTPARTFGSAA